MCVLYFQRTLFNKLIFEQFLPIPFYPCPVVVDHLRWMATRLENCILMSLAESACSSGVSSKLCFIIRSSQFKFFWSRMTRAGRSVGRSIYRILYSSFVVCSLFVRSPFSFPWYQHLSNPVCSHSTTCLKLYHTYLVYCQFRLRTNNNCSVLPF